MRAVEYFNAIPLGDNLFDLPGTEGTVEAMCVAGDESHGGPLYIPTHSACFNIALHFIYSQQEARNFWTESYPPRRITSKKSLWEVLYRRLPAKYNCEQFCLAEPHDYFGGEECRRESWARSRNLSHAGVRVTTFYVSDASLCTKYYQLHEQNPYDIENLTESILQNLVRIAAEKHSDKNEIRNTAAAKTLLPRNLRDADMKCDQELSQAWWCDALASERVFPWLWDLDMEKIRERQRAGNWNWELLVRELSQVKIHEPHDTTLTIPRNLRNRRRIWRILEEARIDDVARLVMRERQKSTIEGLAKGVSGGWVVRGLWVGGGEDEDGGECWKGKGKAHFAGSTIPQAGKS